MFYYRKGTTFHWHLLFKEALKLGEQVDQWILELTSIQSDEFKVRIGYLVGVCLVTNESYAHNGDLTIDGRKLITEMYA